VRIDLPGGAGVLEGDLLVPEGAPGIVVFAHGSGSSRASPRNRMVADTLVQRGLGTLLVDLLTPEEGRVDDATRELRFDVELLASRLVAATRALGQDGETGGLPIGYFGASTGAAAALVAAAEHPDGVAAVVSRGGRPDLARAWLERVTAPTLLIVGGCDAAVLELNVIAYERLRPERAFEVIEGATHLFEEPGALEEVARLAGAWFERHLRSGGAA
jgi:pimeloyl-ACP methyl ester carboxylesterase